MDNVKKYYLLANPFTLTALLLLILNDHYLKIYFPNFITGKLSDFTGLFLFPFFLYVLSGKFLKGRSGLEIIIGFSALLFIAVKTEIILKAIINFLNLVKLPEPNLIADPGDLAALSVLPFSYLLIKYYQPKPFLEFRKYFYNFLFAAYSISIIATSFAGEYVMKPEKAYSSLDKEDRILFLFEEAIIEEKIILTRRDKEGEKFIYSLVFNEDFIERNKLTPFFPSEILARVEFVPTINNDSLKIGKINLESSNAIELTPENDSLGGSIIRKYIIEPFEKKLEQYEEKH